MPHLDWSPNELDPRQAWPWGSSQSRWCAEDARPLPNIDDGCSGHCFKRHHGASPAVPSCFWYTRILLESLSIQVCVCCESSTGQHSNIIKKIQCVFDQWRQDVPSLKGDTLSLQIPSISVYFPLQLRAFINLTGTNCKDRVTMSNFQNAHVDSTCNPRISSRFTSCLTSTPRPGSWFGGKWEHPWRILEVKNLRLLWSRMKRD